MSAAKILSVHCRGTVYSSLLCGQLRLVVAYYSREKERRERYRAQAIQTSSSVRPLSRWGKDLSKQFGTEYAPAESQVRLESSVFEQ